MRNLARLLSVLAVAAAVAVTSSVSVLAQTPGVREVAASDRSIIPLQTRIRFTTMIMLPDNEEILDVICGDKDYWVISATHNIAHVKPAKEGAVTNLDLVTSSGTIYSFLLTEKSGPALPDLKVYVTPDPNAPPAKPKYYTAAEMDEVRSELASTKKAAQAEVDAAQKESADAIASFKAQYPTTLQFAYGPFKYEKPFLIRSIWNDGRFTYIKTDATELPALYELKDGKPAVVNFQVHGGTYIVPKVIETGYLALGNVHLVFGEKDR